MEALRIVCGSAFFEEGSAYQIDCTSYTLVSAGHVLFSRPEAGSAPAAPVAPTVVAAVAVPIAHQPTPASSSTAVWLAPGVFSFQLGLLRVSRLFEVGVLSLFLILSQVPDLTGLCCLFYF